MRAARHSRHRSGRCETIDVEAAFAEVLRRANAGPLPELEEPPAQVIPLRRRLLPAVPLVAAALLILALAVYGSHALKHTYQDRAGGAPLPHRAYRPVRPARRGHAIPVSALTVSSGKVPVVGAVQVGGHHYADGWSLTIPPRGRPGEGQTVTYTLPGSLARADFEALLGAPDGFSCVWVFETDRTRQPTTLRVAPDQTRPVAIPLDAASSLSITVRTAQPSASATTCPMANPHIRQSTGGTPSEPPQPTTSPAPTATAAAGPEPAASPASPPPGPPPSAMPSTSPQPSP